MGYWDTFYNLNMGNYGLNYFSNSYYNSFSNFSNYPFSNSIFNFSSFNYPANFFGFNNFSFYNYNNPFFSWNNWNPFYNMFNNFMNNLFGIPTSTSPITTKSQTLPPSEEKEISKEKISAESVTKQENKVSNTKKNTSTTPKSKSNTSKIKKSKSVTAPTAPKKSGEGQITSNTSIKNLNYWQSLGYNKEKGIALSNWVFNYASHHGFNKDCAKGVRCGVNATGLGNYKGFDKAYKVADILRANKNFKEIATNGINPKTDLPPGAIIIYNPGVDGYHKTAGHIEVVNGKGLAASDGITHNIRPHVSAIFIPVYST